MKLKKILMLCAVIDVYAIANHVAHADTGEVKPLVYRQSADVYAVIGEGTLSTKGCTVTANGIPARIDSEGNKQFIVFIDTDGNEEAQCELRTVHMSKPHTIVAKTKTAIKVASK